MFVRTFAGAVAGIDAVAVTVEVNIAGGGLGMYLVGLPDNAVKESEQRIRAAFENSGERMSGKKVVVSLAPADLRKEGAGFDLPIAVGILAATEQVPAEALDGTMLAGELSLDGTLKPVRGILPMAVKAREEGLRRLIVPCDNACEAAVVEGVEVIGAASLGETVEYLRGDRTIAPAAAPAAFAEEEGGYAEDFADVKGQAAVKRALEIAAAGGHNVLMIGAPGSGKTMLARRLPSILPPLTLDEALETTKIHSVAGKIGAHRGLLAERPFRAPHHLTSQVALIGGGQSPRPGEVSLAHNGILFLDELPEFGRNVLEVLRQPLEERRITVSRARYSVEYPANFTLVAAMNPCPCGYYNHPTRECTCPPGAVHRYPAGRPRPRSAARPIQGRGRRLHQRDDDGPHGARILPDRRRSAHAARTGHGTAQPLGTRLRPHPESGAHDRRSGGRRADRHDADRRGDRLPLARPRVVGTVNFRQRP